MATIDHQTRPKFGSSDIENESQKVFHTKTANVKRTVLQSATNAGTSLHHRRALGNISNNVQKQVTTEKTVVDKKQALIKNESESKNNVCRSLSIGKENRDPEADDVIAFSRKALPDIDSSDGTDIVMVAEYALDIATYLRHVERTHPVNVDYLGSHVEITPRMRAILLDWIVQVHIKFHLTPETLYLTVTLFDRYVQEKRDYAKGDLQLAGITAMFVASKYEEMYPPEMADFIDITDNSFDRQQLINEEMELLRSLSYNVSHPLPIQFLRRYSKANQSNAETHTLAKYLIELMLIEYTFSHVLPSQQAATALFTAMSLLNQHILWPDIVAVHSGYETVDLISSSIRLCKLVIKMSSGKSRTMSVYRKYAQSKHRSIAVHKLLVENKVRSLQDELSDAQTNTSRCY